MHLSRRGLLRAGLATAAVATLGGTTAGCSVPSGSTGRGMTLWYWTGGLSDKVVADARTRFTGVSLKPAQIIWAMATLPMLFIALVTAVMLNSAVRFKNFYRFAYFLPNVTSVVAVAIIFSSVFSTNFGLANAVLQGL